jgi:sugar/nucleoside kinase (ribokinase family)
MTRPQRPRVTVVGDVGLDVCCRLRAPIAAGDDTPAHITSHPGGAGANTAARLARLGVEVELIARIGDDEAGRAAAVELASQGVDCRFAVDPTLPTGRVIVMVDAAGGRTMVSDRGANAALRPEDVVLPPRPGHLHLSGYVLLDDRSRAAGRAALGTAFRAGWTTSVDPQTAAGIAAVGAANFLDWVRGIDLLLPNEAELAALGGPDAALAAAGAVAVTHGRGGASWYAAGDPQRVPVDRVTDTDSTGAGDAFDAGFLAAWLGGESPAVALAAGVRAGTEAAGAAGARDSLA